MTKLFADQIRVVFKRVLLLSLLVTVILVVITYLLEWSIMEVMIGFWVGVIVNLISFCLIVMGASRLLEKSKNGVGAHIGISGISFLGRIVLYALSLFLVAQISLHALIASAIGFSMVGFVLKFFPIADSKEE